LPPRIDRTSDELHGSASSPVRESPARCELLVSSFWEPDRNAIRSPPSTPRVLSLKDSMPCSNICPEPRPAPSPHSPVFSLRFAIAHRQSRVLPLLAVPTFRHFGVSAFQRFGVSAFQRFGVSAFQPSLPPRLARKTFFHATNPISRLVLPKTRFDGFVLGSFWLRFGFVLALCLVHPLAAVLTVRDLGRTRCVPSPTSYNLRSLDGLLAPTTVNRIEQG